MAAVPAKPAESSIMEVFIAQVRTGRSLPKWGLCPSENRAQSRALENFENPCACAGKAIKRGLITFLDADRKHRPGIETHSERARGFFGGF